MEAFEEIRNSNNVLYKLRGKLSEHKEANVTVVPKTKLLYMHISDNSKAFKNGGFDKAASKFVSLSMAETLTLKLRSLMCTMDPKVTELVNSVQPQSGKKRKQTPEDSTEAANLLEEFNAYQQPPYKQQCMAYGQQQQQPIATIQHQQQQQQLSSSYGQFAAPPSYGDNVAANNYYQQQQPWNNYSVAAQSYGEPNASASSYYQQQPTGTNGDQQYIAVPQYYSSVPPPAQGNGWQQSYAN